MAFESKIGHLYMNYDHDKVYKVVNNLLSNAVKFTPSGGRIAVRVENLVRNGREYVAVSVRDTGCGMEEKDKERIFTRFYQVESSHKSQSGSGIGLHLVKGYVDLHGEKSLWIADPERAVCLRFCRQTYSTTKK